MIVVENVVKRYGEFLALGGVTFEVSQGEWLSIMGAIGQWKNHTAQPDCRA